MSETRVIMVTRINGARIMVNPDLIEMMEKQADTIISLTTGNKIVVKESLEEIAGRVVEYRQNIFSGKGGG